MASRPKQQALFFLLGAVLVGGVLGFSAERVLGHGEHAHVWAGRESMYDDLSLTAMQRVQMDSVLDERQAQIQAVLLPVQPRLDSIKASSRTQFRRILTPDQWTRFEARVHEDDQRRKADSTRRVEGREARKGKESK